MNSSSEPGVAAISSPASAASSEQLIEAIQKSLQLLDVPAISSVQSLMGRQASADLSRAVRLLNAALPRQNTVPLHPTPSPSIAGATFQALNFPPLPLR